MRYTGNYRIYPKDFLVPSQLSKRTYIPKFEVIDDGKKTRWVEASTPGGIAGVDVFDARAKADAYLEEIWRPEVERGQWRFDGASFYHVDRVGCPVHVSYYKGVKQGRFETEDVVDHPLVTSRPILRLLQKGAQRPETVLHKYRQTVLHHKNSEMIR